MLANTDPTSSQHVQSITTIMLTKFNEEFGTGEENTVASDHTVEGNRRRGKGIPRIALLEMCLDPRTKSATGIPQADCELIWQYMEEELVELAIEMGPVPLVDVEPPINGPELQNDERAQNDYDVFLNELDEDDNNDVLGLDEDSDDDLRELIDANDQIGNRVDNRGENWTREVVTQMIQKEIELYKAAKGAKLRDPQSGLFSNPLDWWRVHKDDFPYLANLAIKYLAIPATSAPSERVFSSAGLTIAKDRARLESTRANELVFLHEGIPALRKYKEAMNQDN